MRGIKFEYILKSKTKGEIFKQVLTLEEIERGECLLHGAGAMLYNVIARREWTGFDDIHGLGIYDGAIVLSDGFIQEVKWDTYYGWVVSEDEMLGEVNFARIEVIGNRWENPELLPKDNQ